MENLKDLNPEVARKLVAFIDAARDLVGDADCLEAFKLLGVASPQLTEVLGALGIGLTRSCTSVRKINKARNFDPCDNCRSKNIRCKIVSDENSFRRLCEECKKLRLETCDGKHDMLLLDQAGSLGIEGVTEACGVSVVHPTPSPLYGNNAVYGSYTQTFVGAQPQDALEVVEELPAGHQSFARLSSEGYLDALGSNVPIASSSSALPFTPTAYEQDGGVYQAFKAETPAINNQGSMVYRTTHFASSFQAPPEYEGEGIGGISTGMNVRAFPEPARRSERSLTADFDLYTFLQNQSQQG